MIMKQTVWIWDRLSDYEKECTEWVKATKVSQDSRHKFHMLAGCTWHRLSDYETDCPTSRQKRLAWDSLSDYETDCLICSASANARVLCKDSSRRSWWSWFTSISRILSKFCVINPPGILRQTVWHWDRLCAEPGLHGTDWDNVHRVATYDLTQTRLCFHFRPNTSKPVRRLSYVNE